MTETTPAGTTRNPGIPQSMKNGNHEKTPQCSEASRDISLPEGYEAVSRELTPQARRIALMSMSIPLLLIFALLNFSDSLKWDFGPPLIIGLILPVIVPHYFYHPALRSTAESNSGVCGGFLPFTSDSMNFSEKR